MNRPRRGGNNRPRGNPRRNNVDENNEHVNQGRGNLNWRDRNTPNGSSPFETNNQQANGSPYGNPRPYNVDENNENANQDRRNWRDQRSNQRRQGNRGKTPNGSSSFETNKQPKPIGFRVLKEIADSQGADVFSLINARLKPFEEILDSPIDKADFYVLIIKILSKVCLSSFEELKLKILIHVINSRFIISLRNFIIDLPYNSKQVQLRNKLYWDDSKNFWTNVICFYDCIIMRIPSLAKQKCRSLIDGATRTCLEDLKEKFGFTLEPELESKLIELRQKLSNCEDEEQIQEPKKEAYINEQSDEPPEDFRELSIYFTTADLKNRNQFLRKNVIEGGYTSIEHYLDVQYRLLREDCYGPLRKGLNQYMMNPTSKKFDNIRVYKDVTFEGVYCSNNKIGYTVQFDPANKLKHIRWAFSKRLIYGSLLLFSCNNFDDFFIATVLDRDVNLVQKGMVVVSLVYAPDNAALYKNKYIMVENEVYFEPYYHVLTALQDPSFPRQLAMTDYIVNATAIRKIPSYYAEMNIMKLEITTNIGLKTTIDISNELWPTHRDLNLNESQYEAYKSALTQEFAVIQGPPGTGKTYLGVKIAKTLIQNLKKCRFLFICYTNHALDQFLEKIISFEKNVVRVGNQSRNKNLEPFNLLNWRKIRDNKKHDFRKNMMFLDQRHSRDKIAGQLRGYQKMFEQICNGVLSYGSLLQYTDEVRKLEYCYDGQRDPVKQWLFEDLQATAQNRHFDDIFDVDDLDTERDFTEFVGRNEVILDEDIDIESTVETCTFCFDLSIAKTELKRLLSKKSKTNEIGILRAKINLFQTMSQLNQEDLQANMVFGNPLRIPTAERWKIYFSWIKRIRDGLKNKLEPLQKAFNSAQNAYEESRIIVDLEIVKSAKVVAMTTTGAARLRKLLIEWAPEVIIVEEAAEVLESHIVSSINRNCRHLIMIGDHQQLRPSAAHFKLARHYDFEVSLFERMIKNGVHSTCLNVQHRMRPEIAELISPAIYPDLKNHSSVNTFPEVRGMEDNLYFFNHNFMESDVHDSSSRSNPKEGDMTLGLANYIMQQGYAPEDVTILTTYSGQMFYLKMKQKEYPFLSKLKITIVDNYQGEESKIILLSLVRNNNNNKIGFLSTMNRVCVALSRAKEGFYIFGNIEILKNNSDIWEKTEETLNKRDCIGSVLNLKCESHPDQLTKIFCSEDFNKVPEGGCLAKCNILLTCGHDCPLICHGYDREHHDVTCVEKCNKIICNLGHQCPLKCKDDCKPCQVIVTRILPCGHENKSPCHLEITEIKCMETVEVKLPDCGHDVMKFCFMHNLKYVACTKPCEARVDPCGHMCRLLCHVNNDPDHINYSCEKPCAKANLGCMAELMGDRGNHQCRKRCHEPCAPCNVKVQKKRDNCTHKVEIECCKDVNATLCFKKCTKILPCQHHCKKKCSEVCGDCSVVVKKVIEECGHEINVACSAVPRREDCNSLCSRTLPCGHSCKQLCREACSPTACVQVVPLGERGLCGHDANVPCNVTKLYLQDPAQKNILLKHCKSPCNVELACGHICQGSCGECLQGRLHIPCKQPCKQINICGHECREPCNQVCPPCMVPCEVKCPHTKCRHLCGYPCTPCQEPCFRACPHGRCTRRCGEPCETTPCAHVCDRTLSCGHGCRGLCGEPCPLICQVCDPNNFPKDFLGDDFEPDSQFVQLQDCTHVLEVNDMDNMMLGDQSSISIRSCPFCRKPIINTYRYKDIINKTLQTEINPIKTKVYGDKKTIKEKISGLKMKSTTFGNEYSEILIKYKNFLVAFQNINRKCNTLGNNTKIFLMHLNMFEIYINILEILAENVVKFLKVKLRKTVYTLKLETVFEDVLNTICCYLRKNIYKLSQQQQINIGNEIKRINNIVHLSKIVTSPEYEAASKETKVTTAFGKVYDLITTYGIFDETWTRKALEELITVTKASGVALLQKERQLIVKAMGFKQGHWFKCPNGHFYCIGECGGAMVESKCIECGATVGGGNHNLRADNAVATEMDGAQHPAWSNHYNDMRNFEM